MLIIHIFLKFQFPVKPMKVVKSFDCQCREPKLDELGDQKFGDHHVIYIL